jgi:hypothetical protein
MAVIDAKYKATKFANYPNADVYQMLAYRVRFGLDTGHLVYAKGEEEPRIHEVIGHGICPLSCDHPRPAPSRIPEPDVTVSRKIAG